MYFFLEVEQGEERVGWGGGEMTTKATFFAPKILAINDLNVFGPIVTVNSYMTRFLEYLPIVITAFNLKLENYSFLSSFSIEKCIKL